jgi:hypothetical protein
MRQSDVDDRREPMMRRWATRGTRRVRASLRVTWLGGLLLLAASPALAWKEVPGDMPWLGSGGRAHLYAEDKGCFGCTTGSRHVERWGRRSLSGPSPYETVGEAMSFFNVIGGLADAPRAGGAGSTATESGEVVETRALPYGFTIVMIEPTVGVMNFDLTALVRGDESPQGQVAGGSPRVNGWIHYGTRVPATGTLLWFSPAVRQAPMPVTGQAAGNGEIVVNGIRLALVRQGDAWVVTRR